MMTLYTTIEKRY